MEAKANRIALTIAATAALGLSSSAAAFSGYFTAQCAGCHTAAVVGSTATTCNGCHSHGTHPDSTKSSINVAGATDAASYSPGQTVRVTITGGYRSGWIRALLFDQNMNQLAVSTGPNTMGGGAGYPIVLSAPAPAAPGSYTWNVAWYGNRYDATGAAFGARWVDDPNNHDHGMEVVATNAFTVSAPAAPAIAFSPPSLDFGNVFIGSSASLSSQVQNTGDADLTVTDVALCAGTHSDFTFTAPAVPFTVAPGAAAAVTVNYLATHPGFHSHCLAFTSNAANAPTANLPFTGTGVTPPMPVADVNPLSLDFGSVTVGSSATHTFTVGNVGTAPLDVAIALAAGTSAEFSASPTTFTVAAGGSANVTVTYAPNAVGADGGSFLVQSNDPNQPSIPVTVSGSGVAAPTPHLTLSPGSLDLGVVTVGASASLPASVGNGGTAPLDVTAIARCAGTSAEFTWSPAAPFTVAAGGSTALTVSYAPSAPGPDSGCLAITSNDPTSPTSNLTVQGTGIAPAAPKIGVTPQALAFGSVTVGLGGDQTFTVSNTGTATLDATVARAAGTSAEFTVAPATFSVTPGNSQVVTATYTPGAAGADSGSLTVSSNDPATPVVTVTLSGSGVPAPTPSIALDPTAVDFGPVVTGTAASAAVAVRNTGSAMLDVSSISRCSGTSAEFGWAPSAPFQVVAGSSATLTVTYMPGDLGADTGCLAIASNDPANAMINLTLAGSGVAQAVPAIALDPASLDFGTVTIGGSASRTSQVRNTGTAALHVSSVTACSGTSSEFTFAPAGPFDVAAGGSVPLAVTYAPVDAGADAGCLLVASDDPANPSATLDLAGTGAQPPVAAGDVDIRELDVPEEVDSRQDRQIVPEAELVNRSGTEATATARLTATLDGNPIYDQALTATLPALAERSFDFPALAVAQGTQGIISWRLEVDDQDPDVDVATARTRVGSKEDDGDREDLAGPSGASAAPTSGCSSGGAPAGLGLLLALAALLGPTRRRP